VRHAYYDTRGEQRPNLRPRERSFREPAFAANREPFHAAFCSGIFSEFFRKNRRAKPPRVSASSPGKIGEDAEFALQMTPVIGRMQAR